MGDNTDLPHIKIISEALAQLAKTGIENGERLARQEALQGNLTESMTSLSKISNRLMVTVEKLVVDNHNLERQTLNGLADIKERQQENAHKIIDLSKRINTLELAEATKRGADQSNSQHKKFWYDNWFKILTVLIISVPAIVVIYNLIHGKATP